MSERYTLDDARRDAVVRRLDALIVERDALGAENRALRAAVDAARCLGCSEPNRCGSRCPDPPVRADAARQEFARAERAERTLRAVRALCGDVLAVEDHGESHAIPPTRRRLALRLLDLIDMVGGSGATEEPTHEQIDASRADDGLPPIYGAPAQKPMACAGFRWLGQSFAHCDACGQPYWEHAYDQQMRKDVGPFAPDPWVRVPITPEQADAVRRKWCPTCKGPTRETVGMVCQTCGTDYAAAPPTEPAEEPSVNDKEPRR